MGKLFWTFVIFLAVGGYLIMNSYNLNLEEKSDQKTFIKKFASWVTSIGKNTVNLAGHATKMDWLPNENNTNTTITEYIIP